jgi:hypothetical protein
VLVLIGVEEQRQYPTSPKPKTSLSRLLPGEKSGPLCRMICFGGLVTAILEPLVQSPMLLHRDCGPDFTGGVRPNLFDSTQSAPQQSLENNFQQQMTNNRTNKTAKGPPQSVARFSDFHDDRIMSVAGWPHCWPDDRRDSRKRDSKLRRRRQQHHHRNDRHDPATHRLTLKG